MFRRNEIKDNLLVAISLCEYLHREVCTIHISSQERPTY